MDVSVDSRPTVVAVHYDGSLHDGVAHFTARGFRGITGIKKVQTGCGCNDARKEVIAIAKRQDVKWFFEGEWDFSAGRCTIYEFEYDAFTGRLVNGTEEVYGRSAAWSGHE